MHSKSNHLLVGAMAKSPAKDLEKSSLDPYIQNQKGSTITSHSKNKEQAFPILEIRNFNKNQI